MEPMSGGLDQQISDKVDAYRNNPQALQQRYAQNQQLIDLLALQKLKSEKDAAARDMQMKMQQQPQTIKQQRESELLQRTKDDMVKQTAGVMQQKQMQQQKNMQRMAQGQMPQRPQMPQQRPQQPQMPMARQAGGLGGLPIPRMAAGGIVAFQEGRIVRLTEGQKLKIRNQFGDQADRIITAIDNKPQGEAYNVINEQLNLGDTSAAEMSDVMSRTSGLGGIGAGLNLATQKAPPAGPDVQTTMVTPPKFDRPNVSTTPPDVALFPDEMPSKVEPVTAKVEPPAAPMETPSVLSPKGNVDAVAQAAPMSPAQQRLNELLYSDPSVGGGDMGSAGAEAAMQRGFDIADAQTGRQDKADRFQSMIDRLEALEEREYSPDEERSDRLKAFLIGAGGRTNVGSVFGGGAAASINMKRDQKRQRRKRMLEVMNLEKDAITVDAQLAQVGVDLGRVMYSEYMDNVQAATSAAARLTAAQMSALSNEVQREVDRAAALDQRRRDDRDFKVGREDQAALERWRTQQNANDQAKIAVQDANNQELGWSRRMNAATVGMNSLLEQSQKQEAYYNELYGVPQLQSQLSMLESIPESDRSKEQNRNIESIRNNLITQQSKAKGALTTWNELNTVNDRMEQLLAIIDELGKATPNVSKIDESSVTSVSGPLG